MDKKLYVHAMRLKSDYESMRELNGSVISWKPISQFDMAKNIYPDKYEVTFNILAPTTSGDSRQHILTIDCSSPSYPNSDPAVRFITPPVMHPHIYEDQRVCIGHFGLGESLAAFCVRLARFIQFDPLMINNGSIASSRFNSWYRANIGRFPMDRSPLPSIGLDGPPITFGQVRQRSAAPAPQPPTTAPVAFHVNRRSDTQG